ncbi:MAG: class I SAM-dependent methyltransferase [Xanthobacteraceae bacterium]
MPEPWPNPVFENALAYHRTAALVAAVKLDLFSAIGAGATTADAIAAKTDASARGVRILCDFLTVIGLLQKQDMRYSLTAGSARFLDRSSPLALGHCVDFLAAPELITQLLHDPASYVRAGGSDALTLLDPDHPSWVRFARAMAPFAAPGAKRVGAHVAALPTPPRTVLDVAAGHGLYGIEVARAIPQAVVTAVDWAPVLAIAQENATAAGVTDRYRAIVGNAFEVEWGSGFDLVLLPNILHYFDRDACVTLLQRASGSLASAGRIWAVEFVPNEDRVAPPLQATFAFFALATSPGGDAYTLTDLDEIARAAGLRGATGRPLVPTAQTLVTFET